MGLRKAQRIEHLVHIGGTVGGGERGNTTFMDALRDYSLTLFPVRSLCFTLRAEDVIAQLPVRATVPTTCLHASPP